MIETMNTRKELASALRDRQKEIPREDLLVALGSEGLKAWEVGLESKNDDEIIMAYFTCADCGDASLSLTDIDTILGNDPDTVDEFLDLAEALERAHQVAHMDEWPF
jgi:hypothetical protein